jgi:DNA-binding winged helix-turn-helix (wHTH) protein/TolB-like protein
MKRQFGDFELDTETRELRRGGEVVRLQSQPAHVLALLVERAGQVVTRDALREAVWGRDTFVDFDKGLNFAIAQARAALGDSADAPAYIRTLPKRGYQFIAPVVSPSVEPSFRAAPDARGLRAGLTACTTSRALLAAAFVIACSAAILTWRAAAPPALAVIAFDNETGAADLDRYAQTVTDALIAELTMRGGGRVGVIGNAAALRTKRPFRDMAAIGRSLHAKYVVIGQVQRDGDRVRLLAHLIRLPEQTHLWVTRIERGITDPPVLAGDAARRISEEFLRKL